MVNIAMAHHNIPNPQGHHGHGMKLHLGHHSHHIDKDPRDKEERDNHSIVSSVGSGRSSRSNNKERELQRERDKRLHHLYSLFQLHLRYISCKKIAKLSRAFFTWKILTCRTITGKVDMSSNDITSVVGSSSTTSSSYLSLFSENEKLREQLYDSQTMCREVRVAAAKTIACSIFHRRRVLTCRKYLDRWITTLRIDQQRLLQAERQISLDVRPNCLDICFKASFHSCNVLDWIAEVGK